jgi:hypothetical protein
VLETCGDECFFGRSGSGAHLHVWTKMVLWSGSSTMMGRRDVVCWVLGSYVYLVSGAAGVKVSRGGLCLGKRKSSVRVR